MSGRSAKMRGVQAKMRGVQVGSCGVRALVQMHVGLCEAGCVPGQGRQACDLPQRRVLRGKLEAHLQPVERGLQNSASIFESINLQARSSYGPRGTGSC